MLYLLADILKANDEVIRVMALYEDTVHRPNGDSLLIDHAAENSTHHGEYIQLSTPRVCDIGTGLFTPCLLYTSDAADE